MKIAKKIIGNILGDRCSKNMVYEEYSKGLPTIEEYKNKKTMIYADSYQKRLEQGTAVMRLKILLTPEMKNYYVKNTKQGKFKGAGTYIKYALMAAARQQYPNLTLIKFEGRKKIKTTKAGELYEVIALIKTRKKRFDDKRARKKRLMDKL